MSEYIRVWKEIPLQQVESYLVVVGELTSECFSCHTLGIDMKAAQCPHCAVRFRYMGFRRKVSSSYLTKMRETFPHIVFIDFDDLKKSTGKRDARKLLDL